MRDSVALTQQLRSYQTPAASRAVFELLITLLPFVACWYGVYAAYAAGAWWLYALLLVPTVGFFVRLFLIQHDCGHQAFFRDRFFNDWTGRFMGVITVTAYAHWQRAHAIHHATSGNLSRRGVGDIDTLTVTEYLARSPWQRWRYRVYRHPLIMLVIGPLFVFVLQNRLPAGFFRGGWRPWLSTMGTNIGIALLVGILVATIGIRAFLFVHGPIVLMSAVIGGWLFYMQHQFAETCWEESSAFRVRDAALYGSSHYDLPPVLRWFTANIGVHHVHHLCSRIPFYRLQRVLDDFPDLRQVGKVTLFESFKCMRLTLWDEKRRRLVSFRDVMSATNPA